MTIKELKNEIMNNGRFVPLHAFLRNRGHHITKQAVAKWFDNRVPSVWVPLVVEYMNFINPHLGLKKSDVRPDLEWEE